VAFSTQGNIDQPLGEGGQYVSGLSIGENRRGEGLVASVKTKAGQVSRYGITLFE